MYCPHNKWVRTIRTDTGDVRHVRGRESIGYLGPHPTEEQLAPHPGPQAFLVKMPPDSEIGPHFHAVDQFQIVTHGSGRVGHDTVGLTDAHYADAYKVYGPVIAGPDGLDYWVLRAEADNGAYYMPESRKDRQRSRGRHAIVRDVAGSDQLQEADGLHCAFVGLSSGEQFDTAHTAGLTTFVLVEEGNCLLSDETVQAGGLLYGGPRDPRPMLRAGDAGCRLLMMGFSPAMSHSARSSERAG